MCNIETKLHIKNLKCNKIKTHQLNVGNKAEQNCTQEF